MISAKAILFGDPHTGKSLLLDRLSRSSPVYGDTYRSSIGSIVPRNGLFSILEFPSEELEYSTSSDRSPQFTRADEELACKASLFCIITYDIRDPATAEAVFKKWIPIKERLLPESFLFVVGSFLDQATHRKVDMKQMCKACAQKDATYLEISNYEGTNVSLFRQLLIHRINYMLRYRQDLIRRINEEPHAETEYDDDSAPVAGNGRYEDWQQGAAEQKSSSSTHYFDNSRMVQAEQYNNEGQSIPHVVSRSYSHSSDGIHSGSRELNHREVSIPQLEQPIISDSIGSILASCLNIDHWLGYDVDTENLKEIGQGIVNLIENFDSNSSAIDSILQNPHLHGTVDVEEPVFNNEMEYIDSDLDLPEVKAAFQLMGLPYPDLSPLVENQRKSPEAAARAGAGSRRKPSSYLRKLAVTLPNGSDSEMVLDLESNTEQQIELFLLSNNLSENADIRKKLLDVSARLRDEYAAQLQLQKQQKQSDVATPGAKDVDENASVMSLPRRSKGVPNISKTSVEICATRKCKVRINLSSLADDLNHSDDDPEDKEELFIDVIVQKGEVLSDVAERICREFEGFSDGDEADNEVDNELKQKILDHLILSC
eukprot:gene25775-34356_t